MIKEKKHFMILIPMIVLLFMFLLSTKAYAHYKGTCPECGSSNCTYHTTENMCPHQYITSYSCHDCGATGEALQGTRDYDIVYKAPTCTQSGGYVCSWCGHLEYGYESPLGHNYSTCIYYSATQHVKTCSRCGDKVYENHTYAYVPVDGNVHSKYCTECGYSIEEAHTDANGDGICDICGGSLDIEPPTASHSLSITAWTNQDITIDLSATDNFSGVADVKLPDGSIVSGDTVSYTVTANGTYTFTVTDNAGNTLSYPVMVDNIDKDLPTAGHSLSITDWTNQDVIIDLTAGDSLSGVADIKLPDGSTVSGDTASYTVSANGTYTFTVTDNAGNTLDYSVTVGNIDKEKPTAGHTRSPDVWTNGSVTIDLTAADVVSGVASIQLPDGSIVSGSTTSYTVTANGTYTFIVTDTAGNTLDYSVTIDNIDKENPTAGHIRSPAVWTNQNHVIINLTASDSLSGVSDIKLPDSSTVSGDTASYTVTANGTYTFTITDNVGNVLSYPVTVDNIDTEKPTASHSLNISGWTNQDVTINLSAADNKSGVADIKLPDGSTVSGDTASYTVSANGTYTFTITDNAGNTLDYSVTVSNIDRDKPIARHDMSTTGWTNQGVNINLSVTDALSGVASIQLPDGSTVSGDTASYTVTANGTYTFTVTDNAGNVLAYPVTISSFDKGPPTASHNLSVTGWTNQNVTINLSAADSLSGVAGIRLPNGSTASGSTASYTVSVNGTYTFTVTDNAGNTLNYSATVSNIDKEPPTVSHTVNTTAWTNKNVIINLTASDSLSGVASIRLPDGSTVSGGKTAFSVSKNGTYAFTVTDNAGNSIDYSVSVFNIDMGNSSNISGTVDGNWTNKDVAIVINVTGAASGVSSIQLPDGKIISSVTTVTYMAPQNGIYTFIVTDNAGNSTDYSVTVSNIDKGVPTASHTVNISSWTNGSVTINLTAADSLSGVASIRLPDDSTVSADTASYTVSANGTYTFTVTDNAGNNTDYSVTVDNIDTDLPTAEYSVDTTDWTNLDVTINLTAADSLSGVSSIQLPDGSVISADTASYTVTENGTYTFTVTDNAGNVLEYEIEISNIDKNQPTTPEVKYITSEKSMGTGLQAFDTSSFALSGILKYQYCITCLVGESNLSIHSTSINADAWYDLNNSEIIIQTEGIYQVRIRAISNAGNMSEIADYTIVNDYTNPTAQLLIVGDTISIEAWDEISGVASIELPDGSIVSSDKAVYPVSENGTYAFTVTDQSGNEYLCSYKVTTMHTPFYKNPVAMGISIFLLLLFLALLIYLIYRHRKNRLYY